MIRLRDSITWRLILWFLFLALIPAGVVFFSAQEEIRQNATNYQLEILQDHARLYATRAAAEPDREIELAIEMMSTSNGERYALVASSGTYLAHSDPQKVGQSALQDLGLDTLQKLLARTSTTVFDEERGRLIGSYRTSLTDPIAVVSSDLTENTQRAGALPQQILAQFIIALLLVLAGAWGGTALFVTDPIQRLVNFTKSIQTDNAEISLSTKRMQGEIAELAKTLKNLSVSMKKSFSSMETQVEERTREFERRSALLKAVADVGKAITSFRNLAELLEQTTHLINENFGYYHAGIFLLDEHREYAVLSAANSEGGKKMLARKHQLKIGGTSIVGYVTENARARIALDVGADAVYFDNPDLPQTRSEMALPLVVGGQILGALDVQSTEAQAFTDEDISTLQILAEQLAVAIQNANLLNETEKALESARTVYGEISREAWGKILREQPRIGFLATVPGATQISADSIEPHIAKAFETGDIVLGSDNLTISVPIKIRGQSIGAIRLKKSEISEAWTQDETNLAIALSDQLSGALESARLYKESQQRAARESLVSDIAAQISAAAHTDAILRETVQELGQTIGNVSVTFELLDQFNPQKRIEIEEHEYPHVIDEKAGG